MHYFHTNVCKTGHQKYGEKAIVAVFKELLQVATGVLPGNPVVTPQDPTEFTTKDIEEALEAVNLVKERWKIKGTNMCKWGQATQVSQGWREPFVAQCIVRRNFHYADN